MFRAAAMAAVLFVSMGARYRAPNFIVETPDDALAKQIAAAAEKYRRELAVEWLGKPMPNWSSPCVMTVRVGPHLGAGGATTFVFDRGEVFGWRMTIQGSRQRIFDSVLPHEITHMIFASHFRRPLPRWADEGGATCVEHVSERKKHHQMLIQFLRTGRGIAFNRMFAMKQYPHDVMPLYAQGFSVAEFLIRLGGKRKYLDFLGDGLETGQWPAAIQRHYGIAGAGQLQNTWLAWIRQGCPPIKPRQTPPTDTPSAELVAAATGSDTAVTTASAEVPSDAGRRVRPESFSIYQAPAGQSESYAPGSVIPAKSPQRIDLPREPKRLPNSGWYAKGTNPPQALPAAAAPPPLPEPVRVPEPVQISEPVPSQLTRPQPYQRPRQFILEWCAPGG